MSLGTAWDLAFRPTHPHAGMPIRHPVRNARTARVWSSGKESRLEMQTCRFTGAARERGQSRKEVAPAGVLKHLSIRGQRQQEELAQGEEEQAGREEDGQQSVIFGLKRIKSLKRAGNQGSPKPRQRKKTPDPWTYPTGLPEVLARSCS